MSNEQRAMSNEKKVVRGFWYGFLAGAVSVGIIVGVVSGLVFFHNRDKEILEYAEKQIEIEGLREDIINRDPAEFLDVPGVRRAADGARDEFDRKRDEALHRFRSRLSSRARLAD
jgi:hypothetical protein